MNFCKRIHLFLDRRRGFGNRFYVRVYGITSIPKYSPRTRTIVLRYHQLSFINIRNSKLFQFIMIILLRVNRKIFPTLIPVVWIGFFKNIEHCNLKELKSHQLSFRVFFKYSKKVIFFKFTH